MKKYIKSVAVLTAICAVIAALLAAVNHITNPIIEAQSASAANEALAVVLPGGEGFEEKDLATLGELPASITNVYSEKNGGYVFKMTVNGFKPGLVIMCGISADGSVAGATCLASEETYGEEKTFGDNLVGKNLESIADVDSTGTATFTKTAYKNAVKDALTAFAILGGAEIEMEKTPEELLAEALAEALPASEGKCTPKFVPEVLEGVDKVYSADNGSGYVFVIGEVYVGVDVSGKTVTKDVTAENSAIAEAAAEVIASSNMTEIDLTAYEGIHKTVVKAYKTDSGNYVFELHATGYNMRDHYAYEKKPIVIMAAATADGKIVAVETVSQNESQGFGAACADPGFYTQYNGTTEESYKDVDGIAGATVTTTAYNSAIGKVFETIKIMEGAAQ